MKSAATSLSLLLAPIPLASGLFVGTDAPTPTTSRGCAETAWDGAAILCNLIEGDHFNSAAAPYLAPFITSSLFETALDAATSAASATDAPVYPGDYINPTAVLSIWDHGTNTLIYSVVKEAASLQGITMPAASETITSVASASATASHGDDGGSTGTSNNDAMRPTMAVGALLGLVAGLAVVL